MCARVCLWLDEVIFMKKKVTNTQDFRRHRRARTTLWTGHQDSCTEWHCYRMESSMHRTQSWDSLPTLCAHLIFAWGVTWQQWGKGQTWNKPILQPIHGSGLVAEAYIKIRLFFSQFTQKWTTDEVLSLCEK